MGRDSDHGFSATGRGSSFAIAQKGGGMQMLIRFIALLRFVVTFSALGFLLTGLVEPTTVNAETTSQGYPCTFVEGQAWWTTTPGKSGTDFGHVHAGACMPFRQMVSGILQLDVQIQMHNNPGKFQYLNPVLKTDTQELSLAKDYSLKDWTCPTGTCVRTVRVPIDTRLSNYDGLEEIRIRSYVLEPDGNIMHVSINTIVDLRNGKPYNHLDRKAYERGKGWYTKSGYCEGSILSNLPVAPVTSWSPTVQVLNHGASDDLPVDRYSVILDADFHNNIPGTVLKSGFGQLQPTTISLPKLASGSHKLLVKAECDDPRGSTNSGILVARFTIQ
jgi:hypothetical protein